MVQDVKIKGEKENWIGVGQRKEELQRHPNKTSVNFIEGLVLGPSLRLTLSWGKGV